VKQKFIVSRFHQSNNSEMVTFHGISLISIRVSEAKGNPGVLTGGTGGAGGSVILGGIIGGGSSNVDTGNNQPQYGSNLNRPGGNIYGPGVGMNPNNIPMGGGGNIYGPGVGMNPNNIPMGGGGGNIYAGSNFNPCSYNPCLNGGVRIVLNFNLYYEILEI
jgi:hypothetical protein